MSEFFTRRALPPLAAGGVDPAMAAIAPSEEIRAMDGFPAGSVESAAQFGKASDGQYFEPAVIVISGIGPIPFHLSDPAKPGWREA